METILTVSALTEILRDALEKRLPFVWVRGEITNFSRAASGHLYFTLKDERSQLACVWFAGKQRQGNGNFDPLTGEVYDRPRPSVASLLRNGLMLLCAGSLGVYAARGHYQLVVDLAQLDGEGNLALEFEALKAKLAAAGYFDLERKRPLPANPPRVAVIASPHGAAIHDFLELAANRGSGATIRIYPAPAQGNDAAPKIRAALALINSGGWADAIAIIRGGGSLEDLWAFNDEALAKAIYESRLPVVAGIGHEVDFTLADLTADARAATPSHAAQLLWPLRSELWQRLDEMNAKLERPLGSKLEKAEHTLAALDKALLWFSPGQKLERLATGIDASLERLLKSALFSIESKSASLQHATARFQMAGDNYLADKLRQYERLAARLDALNPVAPLKRGYSFLYDKSGPISSIAQVSRGEKIMAALADGELSLTVAGKKPL